MIFEDLGISLDSPFMLSVALAQTEVLVLYSLTPQM